MDTFQLIEELLTRPQAEIQYGFLTMLLEGKVDFIELSNQYVNCLKIWNEDKENQLIEAETCVIESFLDKKVKNAESDKSKYKRNYKHTQRCLHLLNQSKRFNMGGLNEKYSYNEDEGKGCSWYERNKSKTE